MVGADNGSWSLRGGGGEEEGDTAMYTHTAIPLSLPFLALSPPSLPPTLLPLSLSPSTHPLLSLPPSSIPPPTLPPLLLSPPTLPPPSLPLLLILSHPFFFYVPVAQPHHSALFLPFIHLHFSVPTLIFSSSSFQPYSSSFLPSFSSLLLSSFSSSSTPFCISPDFDDPGEHYFLLHVCWRSTSTNTSSLYASGKNCKQQ